MTRWYTVRGIEPGGRGGSSYIENDWANPGAVPAMSSVSTDIVARLKDVVPGLSFNSVGTRISIRGQSTLFSNADPLIVVDGFPYNEPVENLNPGNGEAEAKRTACQGQK